METETARRERRIRRAVAPWAAALLAVVPLQGAQEIPIASIVDGIRSTGELTLRPEGLSFPVEGWVAVFLPLPNVEILEVDYHAQGHVQLTWGSAKGTSAPSPQTPPWHHERLGPGKGRATLDLRTTPAWSPDRVPILHFEGTGEVVLTGLRARPSLPGPEAATQARDEAFRWAPLRVGHTSINFLDLPRWKDSKDLSLYGVLGGAFLLAACGGLLGLLALGRGWRPAPVLAVAAVAAILAGNAAFLVRAWPVLHLAPVTDSGERLRRNMDLHPTAGALAALAREAVGPGERVGVQSGPADWFAWETICFHLQPRPCARVVPGAKAFEGLPGTEPIPADRIDVVVYLQARDPLLPGFAPVASLGPRAFVARRR